jgi:hypothetical protein
MGNLLSRGQMSKMATHPGVRRGAERIHHTPRVGILPPSSGEGRGGGCQTAGVAFNSDLGQRMGLNGSGKSCSRMFSFP